MQENIKKAYLCYFDDNDQKVNGFVEIIEANSVFVKFSTNKNIVTIPFSRVIKIKEKEVNYFHIGIDKTLTKF
jgi:hypothetical protein